VGPACRSLSCCVSCPGWLSWATFPVSTRTIISRSKRALSEAATPVVRGQRRCLRHHTHTSTSAPSHLPVASHSRLPSTVEAEPTPCCAVLHRVTGRELSMPVVALPLAIAGPSSPLTSLLLPSVQVTIRQCWSNRSLHSPCSSMVTGSWRASSTA
jgi:hypothetical protein